MWGTPSSSSLPQRLPMKCSMRRDTLYACCDADSVWGSASSRTVSSRRLRGWGQPSDNRVVGTQRQAKTAYVPNWRWQANVSSLWGEEYDAKIWFTAPN